MVQINYIEHGGAKWTVEIAEGISLMEGALKYRIPGIDGDCGGACACATCHVFVDEAWLAKLPKKEDMEETMLDFAPDMAANSRLSCQIKVTPELDGLVVRMPKSQH